MGPKDERAQDAKRKIRRRREGSGWWTARRRLGVSEDHEGHEVVDHGGYSRRPETVDREKGRPATEFQLAEGTMTTYGMMWTEAASSKCQT